MRHRRLRGSFLVPLACALGVAGCNLVLGIDDFTDAPANTGGGGSTGAGQQQVCTPGELKECLYTGPDATKDVGPCRAGTQACNDDGTGYEACSGEVLPAPKEDCDNVVDDDCNGEVNDGCPCTPNTTAPCYTGPAGTQDVGICKAGTKTCSADGLGYGACVGEQTPMAEDCATADDEDCNGKSFDDAAAGCMCEPNTTAPCYSGPAGTEGVGICKAGTKTCTPDGLGYGDCVGEQTPLTEDCATPADEDCDGTPNQMSAGCLCEPGTTQPCYSGPMGTEKVGICKGGTQTCNPDGLGYGACVGEQTPLAEECSNATDEDCNGSVCGETLWAKQYGLTFKSVAVDPSSNIYVAGSVSGTQKLGNITLTSAGGIDVFVAKLDSSGTPVWGKSFGSATNEEAQDVAVDAAGNVYLTGYALGQIAFGGGMLNAGVFVTKLNSSGAHVWSKGCGGTTASPLSSGRALALDAQGNLLVTGDFGSNFSCAIGMSVTASGAGNRDVFVVKMSGVNGGPIWTKSFGDGQPQWGYGIAADGSNNVLVTGANYGTMNFGGSNITGISGVGSLFVAKLSSSGAHVWSLGPSSNASGKSIAVDASNNVLLAGDFGGLTLSGKSIASNGSDDIFVGKLDTSGTALWLKGFGNQNGDSGNSVAVGPTNRVALGGAFRNSVDFGGGPLASASLDAAFVALFDANAGHLWSKAFSAPVGAANATNDVAFGPLGEVVAAGQFGGSIDFGKGSLDSANGATFLIRVAP